MNNNDQDTIDIPLDITDIISVCQEYNRLGFKIQNQIQNILEMGVEEALKTKVVQYESLPYIKDFLKSICGVIYFGDAAEIAQEVILKIDLFQEESQAKFLN